MLIAMCFGKVMLIQSIYCGRCESFIGDGIITIYLKIKAANELVKEGKIKKGKGEEKNATISYYKS